MSDRRENSVLFSLRELRSIEEDRVKQEEDAEQARMAAEQRAREDEVRRAKEAEEAKIRAAEDRVRREREDKERAEREGSLRLQESERRAQIEAATRLEQSRIEAEARAKVEGKKFPTGLVVGSILGLIVLAGGTMAFLVNKHQEELRVQQVEAAAKADKIAKEAQERELALKREADQKEAELTAQLAKASTDAERANIRAKMAAASEPRHASSGTSKGESKKASGPKIKAGGKDVLEGLDL